MPQLDNHIQLKSVGQIYTAPVPSITNQGTGIPGFLKAQFSLSLSDKNVKELTAEMLTNIENRITTYSQDLRFRLQLSCAAFGVSEFLTKVQQFDDRFKQAVIENIQKVPEQIELFMADSRVEQTLNKQVEYIVSFQQNLLHDENDLIANNVHVTTNRKRPYTTTNWSGPFKHMFDRNSEIYSKKFRFA